MRIKYEKTYIPIGDIKNNEDRSSTASCYCSFDGGMNVRNLGCYVIITSLPQILFLIVVFSFGYVTNQLAEII